MHDRLVGAPERRSRRRRAARWCAPLASLIGLLAGSSGCNVVEAMRDGPLEVLDMVPGANVATGGLDCWLTFEVAGPPPEGVDPMDLRVRFQSPALPEPIEFDWAYIAYHDVAVDARGGPGSGHHEAVHTRPDTPPALGERIKVRFPLSTRGIVADAPSPVWLEAELTWGGTALDRSRRTIEHVYSRLGSDHF